MKRTNNNRIEIVQADTGDVVETIDVNRSRSRSSSNTRSNANEPNPNNVEEESEIELEDLAEIPPTIFKMFRNFSANVDFLANKVKNLEREKSRSSSQSRTGSGVGLVRSGHRSRRSGSRSRSRSFIRSRSRSSEIRRKSRSRGFRSRSRSGSRTSRPRSRSREFETPARVSRGRRDSIRVALDSSSTGTRGRRVSKIDACGRRAHRSTSTSQLSRGMRDSMDLDSRGRREMERQEQRPSHSRTFSRSKSKSLSRSPPRSIISLRASSRDLDINSCERDVLDTINEELEVNEFGPPVNAKLASTINKKLNFEMDVTSETHKKRMAEIKIPQNIQCNKLKVPVINEELLSKHIGLDRYSKRNDNRLANIQSLTTKCNILTIQSTDSLYSNLNKVESEEVKEALTNAIKMQTEAMGMLAQVKQEISRFRRSQLYTNLPKDIRGICFEKLKNDDEKLFGEDIKEKIKENKSNHYKMRTSSPTVRKNFLYKKNYHHQHYQHNQRAQQVKIQKGKKPWNLRRK